VLIGPDSAPGAVTERVEAPARTSTPGQSISAGVFVGVVSCRAGGPNSQELSLSLMLCAEAGNIIPPDATPESRPHITSAAARPRLAPDAEQILITITPLRFHFFGSCPL
jgi:hypothetical protein